MTLLSSAMEMTFTLKDVIYICGGLAYVLWQWFHFGGKIDRLERQAVIDKATHLKELTDHKEAFVAYKSARKASFKEMEDRIDKHMETKMFEPIRIVTAMEERMEKHEEKMEKKFDTMNTKMDKLHTDIIEILKGKR